MMETISFKSTQQRQILVITDEVRKVVKASGIQEGLCVVFNPHSTAGLTINSYLDPATAQDMIEDVDRIVPTRTNFHHVFDTPSDASGHIKTSLVGSHLTIIIENGDFVFGHAQGIMFWEFDGPRERKVHVKLMKG